uniref:Uncharacterized protein n=1 Tax=Arundo donax TaxID=35708 RepID=A0A0A9DCS7_ARUDO
MRSTATSSGTSKPPSPLRSLRSQLPRLVPSVSSACLRSDVISSIPACCVQVQTQGCLQLADQADKEHKKMADKIAERAKTVKTSYKKFVAEVQASTSRVCKVTVPEMAKLAERAIDGLRSRSL